MKKNLLLMGLSRVIVNDIIDEAENIDIYIIEEEELYYKNGLDTYESPMIKKILFSKYIDSDEYMNEVNKLKKEIQIHGVVPVRDYAVRAAANAAEILGVPGLGSENGKILTNKCLLREACVRHNIPHPRFQKINKLDELKDFYRGKPVIFKPATLQASLGISKINCMDDIKVAWENTTSTEEQNSKTVSRNIFRENIAEEFIGGFEVSVETFVKDGEIVFNNITKKLTFDNTFAEKGHTAPACLEKELEEKIFQAKKKFVKSLKIGSGLLHSEWKIENGLPVLIECAGRGPGDYIHKIIEYSYGFDFFKEMCNMLIGNEFNINTVPTKVSRVRYFEPSEGLLKEIKGLESLNKEEVKHWEIDVKVGDYINKVVSSWTRVGYFIVSADTIEEVEEITEEIMRSVEFIIE
ncbi:ATP-grasp domain-containing protein [Clostridium paraputrificum]|uniref:ATP-grasp domain-containing protein n=1 Tax=Clostridium paraputrificum TaxID=29363 RepID=UPI003D324890